MPEHDLIPFRDSGDCARLHNPGMPRAVPGGSRSLLQERPHASLIRKHAEIMPCQNPAHAPHITTKKEERSVPATAEAPAYGLAIAQFANPFHRK